MKNNYNFDEMSFKETNTFFDTATEREQSLYSIYNEEPELFKEKGELLLSPEFCKICGRNSVYIGPNISFFETGRCIQCGELNK